MTMFQLLKIITSIDIFKNEKCKVTFGLEFCTFVFFFILVTSLWMNKQFYMILYHKKLIAHAVLRQNTG